MFGSGRDQSELTLTTKKPRSSTGAFLFSWNPKDNAMEQNTTLPKIHVLYENPDWLPPLVDALKAEGFLVELVELVDGLVDPSQEPAEGIWVNRISPSSHTRGHHASVELTREVLFWLEAHGRRVFNGLRAFEIEMSKLRQDLVLRSEGIRTPKTILAIGRAKIIEAAESMDGPFITKHNQGGKGLGIQLFRDTSELEVHMDDPAFDPGPGGKVILQQYIQSPSPHITRVEIVGEDFLFAMRSSTEQGFQLCPSDVCQAKAAPDVCPIDGGSKFSPAEVDASDPLVKAYIRMCKSQGIEVAGIEFIEDAEGNRYTYDINGTTNYNSVLGEEIGVDGMAALARHIRRSTAA
jgi:glutathione synthase/RimK-type ligase-like ATP-grasp enzyme